MTDGLMDADDLQRHRHSCRYTAQGLKVFYDSMLEAGLPKKLARELTVDQYRWVLTPSISPVIGMLQSMREQMGEDEE